jgi:hypothetical protein
MKTVFVLKITHNGEFGFYDGSTNWSDQLSEAKQFTTYPEAEAFLRTAIENNGWGGFIQIEKYFISHE